MINYNRGNCHVQLNEVGPVSHTYGYINGWKEAIGYAVADGQGSAQQSTYQFGIVLDPDGRDMIHAVVYANLSTPGDGGIPMVITHGSYGVVMASEIDTSSDSFVDIETLETNIVASCVKNPNAEYDNYTFRTRYYVNHDAETYSDDFYTNHSNELRFDRWANDMKNITFWFVVPVDPGNPAFLASLSVDPSIDYGSPTPPSPPSTKDYFVYAYTQITYDPMDPGWTAGSSGTGSSICTLQSVSGTCPNDLDVVYIGEAFSPGGYYEDANGVRATNAAEIEDPNNPGTYYWYYYDANDQPHELTPPVTYYQSGEIDWNDITELTSTTQTDGYYDWSGTVEMVQNQLYHYLVVYGYTDDPNGTISIDSNTGLWGTCLRSDTKISTPDGDKRICDIKVGDIVYGKDLVITKVKKVRPVKVTGYVQFEFSDGRLIFGSSDHRFYNVNKGFFEKLERFRFGDGLLSITGENPYLVGRKPVKGDEILYGIWTESGSYYANGLLSGTTEANKDFISDCSLEKAIDMALSLSIEDLDMLARGDIR